VVYDPGQPSRLRTLTDGNHGDLAENVEVGLPLLSVLGFAVSFAGTRRLLRQRRALKSLAWCTWHILATDHTTKNEWTDRWTPEVAMLREPTLDGHLDHVLRVTVGFQYEAYLRDSDVTAAVPDRHGCYVLYIPGGAGLFHARPARREKSAAEWTRRLTSETATTYSPPTDRP
jgi:hypothetical protein